MKRWVRAFLSLVVTTVALALAAVPVHASANDWMFAATPLPAASPTVSGALDDGNPVDWYYFEIKGVQQVHVDLEHVLDDANGCARARVFTSSGDDVGVAYTTPYDITLYVRVQRCMSGPVRYNLAVRSGGLIGPAPHPAPVPTSEPDDSPDTPSATLLDGTWYSGTITSENDQDWLRVNTDIGDNQKVAVWTAGNGPGRVDFVDLDTDRLVESVEVSPNGVTSKLITLDGVTPYGLRVTGTFKSWGPSIWWVYVHGISKPIIRSFFSPTTAKPRPRNGSCRITSKRMKPRSRIHATCKNVPSGVRVEARWYRYAGRPRTARRTRSVFLTVNRSRMSIPTSGRSRGTYRVTLMRDAKRLGTRLITIR